METVDFNFTLEQVETILHRDDAHEWYDAMVEMLPKYQIDTPKRVAGFIAQTAHESASYKTITENLNYSAKALDAIFGKYFKSFKDFFGMIFNFNILPNLYYFPFFID